MVEGTDLTRPPRLKSGSSVEGADFGRGGVRLSLGFDRRFVFNRTVRCGSATGEVFRALSSETRPTFLLMA